MSGLGFNQRPSGNGLGSAAHAAEHEAMGDVANKYAEDRVAYDTVSGSGALNGQTTDSGHTWSLTGTGYLTTAITNGYIAGTQNTYCHINTGQPIVRAVQNFSGALGTVSIGLDNQLTDMIHQNFTSGGAAALTYWKTGVGASQQPQWTKAIKNCPNINDGVSHALELEVIGRLALAYVDGDLVNIAYDSNFPSIAGNWMFAQIHDSGDKIYGVESRTHAAIEDTARPNIDANMLMAAVVEAVTLIIGDKAGNGFVPEGGTYLWTDDADGHVFGSSTVATIKARSRQAGYAAKLAAVCAIGVETALQSSNDGVGRIMHQGSDRIKFPFNLARIDLDTVRILASGLPASSAGLDTGELWVDAGVVKRV